ncbi:50S ribosomal protein L4 [candidate division WOR-3 bacterium]|nr:50S ribosomal protein L4 [candidate division WOR-3 bacterium]
MKLKVHKLDGTTSGTVDFPDEIFASPVNENLLWEAVEAFRANIRQGTAKTKTRGEVEGSSAKMFRQKHLGRARMGSRRSPARVHGGVAHGPQPRSYRKQLSTATRRRALLEAIKQKLQTGKVVVMEDIKLSEPKTRLVAQALKPVREKSNASLLLVLPEHSSEFLRAARNLRAVEIITQIDLNAYSIWRPDKLVLFKSACRPLVARWK